MPSPEPTLTFTVDHPSLSFNEAQLYAHLHDVCRAEGYEIEELSIVFTTHKVVREINVQYLDHDYNTDVIAFQFSPSEGSRRIDGEIYVDLDMALERCDEFGASFEEEVFRYAIHGLLHLMNYSDKTLEQRTVMKDRESMHLRSIFKS